MESPGPPMLSQITSLWFVAAEDPWPSRQAAARAGRDREGTLRGASDSAWEEWKRLPRRGGGPPGRPLGQATGAAACGVERITGQAAVAAAVRTALTPRCVHQAQRRGQEEGERRERHLPSCLAFPQACASPSPTELPLAGWGWPRAPSPACLPDSSSPKQSKCRGQEGSTWQMPAETGHLQRDAHLLSPPSPHPSVTTGQGTVGHTSYCFPPFFFHGPSLLVS